MPAEAIRPMACDCGIHRYVSNPQGTVIDDGRRQRTAPDPLFDALMIRDHGCRWPDHPQHARPQLRRPPHVALTQPNATS